MITLLILLSLFSSPIYSKPPSVRIGGLVHIPPYFDKTKDNGIEMEIITAAFKEVGYEDIFTVFANNKRGIQLLLHNDVDILVSNKNNTFYSKYKNIFHSTSFLNYIDCAISSSKLTPQIKSVNDLSKFSVWGFPNASLILGESFAKAVKNNSQYIEDIQQLSQPKAIMKNRVDVVISDRNIFMFQAIKDGYSLSDFKFTRITEKTPRQLRFKDPKLRDQFNKGFRIIKKNGELKKVLEKYKDSYFSSCN